MTTQQHHILPHPLHLYHGAFGSDTFGRRAESFARMFGTPRFLIVQTILVAGWIALNVSVLALRWDPYPFILLNLAFSLQAAYAAPLILLAQTRQADRDKAMNDADTQHREALSARTLDLLELTKRQGDAMSALLDHNTKLTEELGRLTRDIHGAVAGETPAT